MAFHEPRYLYGFYDPGGEYLMVDAGKPGWVLVAEEIGHDPGWQSGWDYSNLPNQGLGTIVQLDNGRYPNGTIPEPEYYDDFAQRCASFCGNSQGCELWVIGNEMNCAQERPHDQPITPELYARCYQKCRTAIHDRVGPGHRVLIGAVAPSNTQTAYPGNESGDWVQYLIDVLRRVEGACDGIALHTCTWGSDPNLITSNERMDPPYHGRRKQFRAYRDFMEAIPPSMRQLPVYITKANQGGSSGAWVNEKRGWIARAYDEIDGWNRAGGQQIRCLLLYRWSTADQWSIADKEDVVAGFQEALTQDYCWGYQPEERFFPETGKRVRGTFLERFDRYGQELCGLPITDEILENGLPAQYFEHVAMEERAPGQVRLKLIGSEVYASRQRIAELEEQVARLQARIAALEAVVPPGHVSKPAITDIVDALPKHPTKRYDTRSLDEITYLVVHHSATRPDVSAERMARYHVEDLGWPGIGYHFVIDEDGTINQTNDLASVSYHAAQANAYSVGMCFTGDFTETIPTEEQLDAGAHLIAWLLQELDLPIDRIHGHREEVSGTTCPGEQWASGQKWRDLLLARVRRIQAGGT
jgi:hypothetical protein